MFPRRLVGNAGFVLPTTLLLLAVLTMAAGYFAQWTQEGVEKAISDLAGSKAELEMESTSATLIYLLSTRLYTRGGLRVELEPQGLAAMVEDLGSGTINASSREIALDGRPYYGIGQSRFSLQDCGGLLSLNTHNSRRLERLLGLLDVPVAERSALVAKLKDYIDPDDLHRLNGAEADAYRKAGRPLPPNRPLQTPWESRRVLGWQRHDSLWKDHRLPLLTTVVGGGSINLNTSPVEILETLDGIDLATARRIVAARPLSGLAAASRAAGRPLQIDPMALAKLASKTLRLLLWHPESNRQRLITLELSPLAEKHRPWKNIYELELPINYSQTQDAPIAAPSRLFTAADLVFN